MEVILAAEDFANAALVRSNLMRLPLRTSYQRGALWERCQILVFDKPDGSVKEVVLIPRDKKSFERWSGIVVSPDHERREFKASELEEVVR